MNWDHMQFTKRPNHCLTAHASLGTLTPTGHNNRKLYYHVAQCKETGLRRQPSSQGPNKPIDSARNHKNSCQLANVYSFQVSFSINMDCQSLTPFSRGPSESTTTSLGRDQMPLTNRSRWAGRWMCFLCSCQKNLQGKHSNRSKS